jgi:hypothetical protein
MAYSIELFSPETPSELTDNERLFLSLARNGEKLNGTLDVYDDHLKNTWGCTEFGINTVKAMKTSYAPGFSRWGTSLVYQWLVLYHLFPFEYLVFSIFDEKYPTVFGIDEHLNTANQIRQIGIEKQVIAQYLQHQSETVSHPSLKSTLLSQSVFLDQEAQLWIDLGEQYEQFARRSILLSTLKSLQIINEMHSIVEQIVTLEEQFLSMY